MDRPSKERLEEIRKFWLCHWFNPATHVEDLLAEIDALQTELDLYSTTENNEILELAKDFNEKCEQRANLMTERDQLRERIAKLEIVLENWLASTPTDNALQAAEKRTDELESELRGKPPLNVQASQTIPKLFDEIDQLKERVAKLRRQLELTGNACGLAKTFLMFHGKPSQQLDNCAEIMEKHEEMAFECLSIDEASHEDDKT